MRRPACFAFDILFYIAFKDLPSKTNFYVNFVLCSHPWQYIYLCIYDMISLLNFYAFSCLFVITGIDKVGVKWLSVLQVRYGKSCNILNVYRSVADPQICSQSIIRWHGSQISTFSTPDMFGSNSSIGLRNFKWPLWKPDTIINMLSIKYASNIDISLERLKGKYVMYYWFLNGFISRLGSVKMKNKSN